MYVDPIDYGSYFGCEELSLERERQRRKASTRVWCACGSLGKSEINVVLSAMIGESTDAYDHDEPAD